MVTDMVIIILVSNSKAYTDLLFGLQYFLQIISVLMFTNLSEVFVQVITKVKAWYLHNYLVHPYSI